MKTTTYRVKGSHRTERQIRTLLSHDPDIHSGMLPKGNFNLRLIFSEYKKLKTAGIKITIDKRFSGA